MSAVVDKKIELPSGWMEVSDAHCQQKQYCIVSYQKADGRAPLVVTRSLVIDKAGEWQLHANGHLVDTSVVPLLASFPEVLPESDVLKLMSIVNELNTCVGNPELKFISLGKAKKNRRFLSVNKEVVAFLDSNAVVTVDGETYLETVRCSKCYLLTTEVRCPVCTSYCVSLNSQYHRSLKSNVKSNRVNYR